MEKLSSWSTVAHILALLVLVGVFVLALVGRMDPWMAAAIGALAVAVVIE